jgi:hypothetical protein
MRDLAWMDAHRAVHEGGEPAEEDRRAYLLTRRYPGTGEGGAWRERDRQLLDQLLTLVGPALLTQIGRRGGTGTAAYSAVARVLACFRLRPGPDGTCIAVSRPFPRGVVPTGTAGWTWGNVIILAPEHVEDSFLLIHEYVHVLQYRQEGIAYGFSYARQGFYDWAHNAYEKQAVLVEGLYRANPWLPPLWEMAR